MWNKCSILTLWNGEMKIKALTLGKVQPKKGDKPCTQMTVIHFIVLISLSLYKWQTLIITYLIGNFLIT